MKIITLTLSAFFFTSCISYKMSRIYESPSIKSQETNFKIGFDSASIDYAMYQNRLILNFVTENKENNSAVYCFNYYKPIHWPLKYFGANNVAYNKSYLISDNTFISHFKHYLWNDDTLLYSNGIAGIKEYCMRTNNPLDNTFGTSTPDHKVYTVVPKLMKPQTYTNTKENLVASNFDYFNKQIGSLQIKQSDLSEDVINRVLTDNELKLKVIATKIEKNQTSRLHEIEFSFSNNDIVKQLKSGNFNQAEIVSVINTEIDRLYIKDIDRLIMNNADSGKIDNYLFNPYSEGIVIRPFSTSGGAYLGAALTSLIKDNDLILIHEYVGDGLPTISDTYQLINDFSKAEIIPLFNISGDIPQGCIYFSILDDKVSYGFFWLISTFAMGTIPFFFGYPFWSEKFVTHIRADIYDDNNNVVKSYIGKGKGKAYSAAYWGYFISQKLYPYSLTRAAKSKAIYSALLDLRGQIIEDKEEIIYLLME